MVNSAIENIAQFNTVTLGMCISCVIFMTLFKEFANPKIMAKIKVPVPIELAVVSFYVSNFIL